MSRYHDDSSMASDPGNLSLAIRKLLPFKRRLDFLSKMLQPLVCPDALFDEHLRIGDSRGAIVVQSAPSILVAAYTDELDCVVMLRFPEFVRRYYAFEQGTRLLTVNTYQYGSLPVRDLHPGPRSLKRFKNFFPMIAEFLSDDIPAIERRKAMIAPREWDRIACATEEYRRCEGSRARNGNPYYSAQPTR